MRSLEGCASLDHCLQGNADFLIQSVVNDVLKLLFRFYLLIEDTKCYVLENCQSVQLIVYINLLGYDIDQEFVPFIFRCRQLSFPPMAIRRTDYILTLLEEVRLGFLVYDLIDPTAFKILNAVEERLWLSYKIVLRPFDSIHLDFVACFLDVDVL